MRDNKNKSKWGMGIYAFYGSFIIFILVLVLYVSIQDFQMVEDNYYEKDLAYQNQIDKIGRAGQLEKDVEIGFSADNQRLKLTFPVLDPQPIEGQIVFYRPSNSRYDVAVPIKVDSLGNQEIEISNLIRGNWQLKISWMVDSVEYYSQSRIIVN
ncbi:MAG: FixH family protein [Candidatus Zixiibacteriota bacterium]